MKTKFTLIFALFFCRVTIVLSGTEDDDLIAYFNRCNIDQSSGNMALTASVNMEPNGNKDILFSYAKSVSEKGYSIGDYFLGWCYEGGEGCKFDQSLAFNYFSKAAKSSIPFPWSFMSLGECYFYGIGTPIDYKQAMFWFNEAIKTIRYDFFLSNTYFCMGVIFQKGGNGIMIDLKQCCICYEQAAKLGLDIAAMNLSNRYLNGEGVPKDLAKSLYWVEKAAEFGQKDAQLIVGISYIIGNYYDMQLPANKEKGINWIKKSAEQGNINAMKALNELGL